MSALTNRSSRSSSSTGSSAIHPLTPPSTSSGLPVGPSGSPVSIVSFESVLRADSPPEGQRHGQILEQGRIVAEPIQLRDVGPMYGQKNMDMLSKSSFQSVGVRDRE